MGPHHLALPHHNRLCLLHAPPLPPSPVGTSSFKAISRPPLANRTGGEGSHLALKYFQEGIDDLQRRWATALVSTGPWCQFMDGMDPSMDGMDYASPQCPLLPDC